MKGGEGEGEAWDQDKKALAFYINKLRLKIQVLMITVELIEY